MFTIKQKTSALDDTDAEQVSEDEDNETSKFDANTHAGQMKDVFSSFYGLDLESWSVCQVANSAPVNIKTSRLLSIPHIACLNLRLNSEVNAMVHNDELLKSTLYCLARTMSNFMGKLTDRAVLRNLSSLSPFLYYHTRWAGKLLMLKRFFAFERQRLKKLIAWKMKYASNVRQTFEILFINVYNNWRKFMMLHCTFKLVVLHYVKVDLHWILWLNLLNISNPITRMHCLVMSCPRNILSGAPQKYQNKYSSMVYASCRTDWLTKFQMKKIMRSRNWKILILQWIQPPSLKDLQSWI